jgi:Uma2 family endonuclease
LSYTALQTIQDANLCTTSEYCPNPLAALDAFVKTHQLGAVFCSPINVLHGDQEMIVKPDIVFLSTKRQGQWCDGKIIGSPDLIIEILSPASLREDKRIKFKLYETSGVKSYWMIDSDERTAEIYKLKDGKYILQNRLVETETLQVYIERQSFRVELKTLFRS